MAKIKKHLVVNCTERGFVSEHPSFLKNLSFELDLAEIGALSTLLAMPDDWDFSVEGLAAISSDSVEETKTILHRLVKKGYLFFDNNVVRIFDEPVMKAGVCNG